MEIPVIHMAFYHFNSTKGTYFLLRNHSEPLTVGCTQLSSLLQKKGKICYNFIIFVLSDCSDSHHHLQVPAILLP
jgi:hypothetical protein